MGFETQLVQVFCSRSFVSCCSPNNLTAGEVKTVLLRGVEGL